MGMAKADLGSFRDPCGTVFRMGDEIYRAVMMPGREHYDFVQSKGLLDELAETGKLVETREVDRKVLNGDAGGAYKVLQHSRVPFVSYPYEWSFPMLKQAALLHLEIQLQALESGITLSDASAYNIQFKGPKPVFIDTLSFREYREGEIWVGHKQFCEQFLNPLLLRSLFGMTHNSWYRGNLEGIETEKLASLLPWYRNFSLNILSHVTLQARLQRKAVSVGEEAMKQARNRGLSKTAFTHMLIQLRDWIKKLEPKDTGKTVWGDYEQTHTYGSDEEAAKQRFIAEFCNKVKPAMMFDFGCNSGEYSQVALESGAERAVGFDFDQGALERAFARATSQKLDLLPLYLDAANPSPGQGWNNQERKSLNGRDRADALMALAFEHHLAIGRNIPMNRVVEWLVSFAPVGVVEFVQKSDPTVQQLLMLREDIFDTYTEDNFERFLKDNARIIKKERVATTGRTLYWYDRS